MEGAIEMDVNKQTRVQIELRKKSVGVMEENLKMHRSP
jgi:hypothetical protein